MKKIKQFLLDAIVLYPRLVIGVSIFLCFFVTVFCVIGSAQAVLNHSVFVSGLLSSVGVMSAAVAGLLGGIYFLCDGVLRK